MLVSLGLLTGRTPDSWAGPFLNSRAFHVPRLGLRSGCPVSRQQGIGALLLRLWPCQWSELWTMALVHQHTEPVEKSGCFPSRQLFSLQIVYVGGQQAGRSGQHGRPHLLSRVSRWPDSGYHSNMKACWDSPALPCCSCHQVLVGFWLKPLVLSFPSSDVVLTAPLHLGTH